ncbi:MAG: ankyrin repeat domain-containing protein [Acidobacteria bacterium]|nr:ankyrin repeat domain-containing protein [Acidobacteriota bacterium]
MNRKQNSTTSLRMATPKKLTAGDPDGASQTDPNGSAEIGETVLFDAVRLGDVDDVNFLLSAGAAVNATDSEGWTPLMWATVKGYAEIARALLAAGADVHVKNNKGWTALRLAVSLNDTELARPLIDAGADVNDRDQKGSTALMQAAGEKSVESLDLLLSYGADANLTDEAGDTAMTMAARNGYAELVRRLADAGATSECEHRAEGTDGGLFSESELQHLIEKMDGFLPGVPAPGAAPTPAVDVLEIQDLAPVAAASSGTLERLASALEGLRASAAPVSRVSVADAAHKLMLSLPEAAALSGLSRRHLCEAMKKGTLKSLRTGKGWRIKRAKLDAYVKQL